LQPVLRYIPQRLQHDDPFGSTAETLEQLQASIASTMSKHGLTKLLYTILTK
jgi:hypothetical protein